MTTWSDLLRPGDATNFFERVTPRPRVQPMAPGFSESTAVSLMELCRLVYRHDVEEDAPRPEPTRASFLAPVDLTQTRFFLSRETDTQAMLVEALDRSFSVLVFRGTEDARDAREDIEARLAGIDLTDVTAAGVLRDLLGAVWPEWTAHIDGAPKRIDTPSIRIHFGFQQCLDSVWDDIDRAVRSAPKPIVFTGHSLGAALATIAAYRARPQALYTFGSPRVGNATFAAALAALVPVFRVVDDEDLVTMVPFESWGYAHAGDAIRLKAPAASWLAIPPAHPPKPLADHAPVNYVDRMSTAVPPPVAPVPKR